MTRILLAAVAMLPCFAVEPGFAGTIVLDCTLKAGNRLPLGIAKRDVTASGAPLKNLDPKSVSIRPRTITFKQAFGTYDNAWRIDRTTMSMTFKTVLQPAAHIVIDERGSCSGVKVTVLQARAKPTSSFRAMIAELLR